MYYYNNKIPNTNDIVFVKITTFSNSGTYCELLEYNNVEGFILNTELDRRVYDPKKCFKVDHMYPMLVLSVTNDKIDLSYKKIAKDTRNTHISNFSYIDKLYSIIKDIEHVTTLHIDILQKIVVFPKLIQHQQKYLTDAQELYYDCIKNPDSFLSDLVNDHKETYDVGVSNIKARTIITKIVVYQNFDFWIFESNGIEKLKTILTHEDFNTLNVNIKYISSPKYQLVIECDNESFVDDTINNFTSYISEVTNKYKCKFAFTKKETIQNKEYNIKPLNYN